MPRRVREGGTCLGVGWVRFGSVRVARNALLVKG